VDALNLATLSEALGYVIIFLILLGAFLFAVYRELR